MDSYRSRGIELEAVPAKTGGYHSKKTRDTCNRSLYSGVSCRYQGVTGLSGRACRPGGGELFLVQQGAVNHFPSNRRRQDGTQSNVLSRSEAPRIMVTAI